MEIVCGWEDTSVPSVPCHGKQAAVNLDCYGPVSDRAPGEAEPMRALERFMKPTKIIFTLMWAFAFVLASWNVKAAPQATIYRIDPRVADTESAPILSSVIEISEPRSVVQILSDCMTMHGDAQYQCMSEHLAKEPLYKSYPFLDANAILTVMVNNAEYPAKFDSKYKWSDSPSIQGVGTAWLIAMDVGGVSLGGAWMESRLADAKAVAEAFVNKMAPQDIADIVLIGDAPLRESKWMASSQKASLLAFIQGATAVAPAGRSRALATALKQAALDGFQQLGNAGGVQPPMHQAMVFLSNGVGGTDPSTSGPGGQEFAKFASNGRFPENNTAAPMMPVPIISLFLPTPGIQEELNSARDFMTNLANPDHGGFFDVVRGNGAAVAGGIVDAVRARFGNMYLVRWRVSCLAPTTTQSFKLNFNGTNPQIIGDNTFANVPIGVNPMAWPLDVNVKYTQDRAQSEPPYPGGHFTIYGNFCWGGNASGVQAYFLPPGTQAPASLNLSNLSEVQRAQQQLIAQKLVSNAESVTDSSATFVAPSNTDWIWGSGAQAVARIVVYDTTSRRMSGATANTILSVNASSSKPFNFLWVGVGAFAVVVVILLVLILVRSGSGGSKGRRGGNPPPAPVMPPGGGYGPPPGVPPYGAPPGPGGYGGPPPGGGYGGPPPGGGYGVPPAPPR